MIRLLFALSLTLSLLAFDGSDRQAFAMSAPALIALSPDDIDPARLLAPPPAPGSAEEKAELAELHDIQDHRTVGRFDQAKWDADHGNWAIFASVLGPKFDINRLPATAKVLTVVQNDQKLASDRAKAFFKRPRPWVVDPSIHGCEHAGTDPLSSFPSGHTIAAFAMGAVLADLMTQRAQEILARSDDYAYSRLVCGMHYRSDTVQGEVLGEIVAADILHDPKMQADLAAARAELKAAGLTGS